MAIVILRYWAAAKEAAGVAEDKVSAQTLAGALEAGLAAVRERAGSDLTSAGSANAGPAAIGSPDAGTDHAGTDHAGTDHAGTDHSGTDHAGTDHAGTDHSGTDHAGAAGAGTAGAGTAERGSAAPGSAAAGSAAVGPGPATPGRSPNDQAERLRLVLARSSFLIDGHPAGTRPPESIRLSDAAVIEVLPPFAGG